MRRILAAIFVMLMVCSLWISIPVQAADEITVIIDGRKIDFPDAKAYIDANGRAQIPARFIGEALGARVEWMESARRVIVERRSLSFNTWETKTIYFYSDSEEYMVQTTDNSLDNRDVLSMDTKAVIENSRIYIPARYVAEALGAEVGWDGETKTVTIKSNTITLGGFVIPQCYTDDVRTFNFDGVMGVSFDITLGGSYQAPFDVRKGVLLHVVSQKIGQDSIDRIDSYMTQYYKINQKNPIEINPETFLDSETGQYVRITRLVTDNFRVHVFDKGINPPAE